MQVLLLPLLSLGCKINLTGTVKRGKLMQYLGHIVRKFTRLEKAIIHPASKQLEVGLLVVMI